MSSSTPRHSSSSTPRHSSSSTPRHSSSSSTPRHPSSSSSSSAPRHSSSPAPRHSSSSSSPSSSSSLLLTLCLLLFHRTGGLELHSSTVTTANSSTAEETSFGEENINLSSNQTWIVDENTRNSTNQTPFLQDNSRKSEDKTTIVAENLNISADRTPVINENIHKYADQIQIVDETIRNSTDRTPINNENDRNDYFNVFENNVRAQEERIEDGRPFTIEDLLAVESRVTTTRVRPEEISSANADRNQDEGAGLKREIHEIEVPKLDEAGLNYEFLYRAWEDIHGVPHRYGHPKLSNQQALQRQKFHHREERKNGTTRGQYRFRLPHGKIQVVSYRQVDDEYLAKVTYLNGDQEQDCLGISEGCKLGVAGIDVGEFDGDIVVGSTPGSSYDTSPIIQPKPKNPPQYGTTSKPTYAGVKGSSHRTPAVLSHQPTDTYSVNPNEHRPTNIRKSPGLFDQMKKDLGLKYGVNKQVYVGYGYGGGVPTFNYGPGPNGSIIDFTDEVQTENTKQKEESPEGPDYANLKNMKAYFDPILSDDAPVKYVPPPKKLQGHAEFFIPSNKIIKHFHSHEKVVGSRPVQKPKKTFTAFEQPSVTISPPPSQYGSYDYYEDDFLDNYYDYDENIHPTTYKPPYIPIFVKRPEGPIDPNYINLPSFSKTAIGEHQAPNNPPDYVESSYGSLSGQKHDQLLPPPSANFGSDSFQPRPDTEGRKKALPTYGDGGSNKKVPLNSFIEDLKAPPTAPQLYTPPIYRIPATPIPSYKSTIPPDYHPVHTSSHPSHSPVPTSSPDHVVSSTFKPLQNLKSPVPSYLLPGTQKPNQHFPTPKTYFISPNNSIEHSQLFNSQSGYIPTNNSTVSIQPGNLVKSVTSFTGSVNINSDFIQVPKTQENSYLPPTGIKPTVSSESHHTRNKYSHEQPSSVPHHQAVSYPKPPSYYRPLPTKPVIIRSGFVPSSPFSVPVTKSNVHTPSSQGTIEHSFAKSSAPTGGFVSSPQLNKFIPNKADVSPSGLYEPHNLKGAPQYPPLGNPNYRTSIIRFPDSESDLRLVPASRPQSDSHRNRIINFKLEESQHSVSEAFKALDKFHAQSSRIKNSRIDPASTRKLGVAQRSPSLTREVNTHEVIVSKSSSLHHKNEQTPPQSQLTRLYDHKQGLKNTVEPVYHLYHPPIAGVVSPARYSLRPRYPYPPYRIPRLVPLFYPFYGDVTVPVHPLSRTLAVPRSRSRALVNG